MFKGSKISKYVLSFLGGIFASYIRLVQQTSRVSFKPEDIENHLVPNTPLIMAMWHGQFMMLPTLRPATKYAKVKAMVARHADAELIGQALLRFDVELVRGAGAGARKKDRGGATALRSSLTALEQDYSVLMTADIPPGPARVAGQGIITMAKLSGRPIFPIAVATSRYISMNTWSRFTINLPFSKMIYITGNPIYVSKDADEVEIEKCRTQLETVMNDITAQAYSEVGANATSATPPNMFPDDFQLDRNYKLKGYKLLTSALRPLLPYFLAKRAKKGKEDLDRQNERFGLASIPRPEGRLIWFHAASVGETNVILPLMHGLKSKYPHIKQLLTTGTVTSANIAEKRMPEGTTHQYVPVDAPQYVRRFLDHWKPDIAFFTESEIWPNLLVETGKLKIPLILLNGTMSEKSFKKWRKQSSTARILFSQFHMILAQNNKLAKKFNRLGARKVHAVGNLKIDAPVLPVNEQTLTQLRQKFQNRKVFLAASTHAGEDEIFIDAHKQISQTIPDLLTIIVPRHPRRGYDIQKLVKDAGLNVKLRSKADDIEGTEDIYIADTIGEMGIFYSLAQIAFMGGSLIAHGGQNPIEAIRLNTCVLTGPHTHNFHDTYNELRIYKGTKVLKSVDDISSAVITLLQNQESLDDMKEGAQKALGNLSGAFDKTIDLIAPYLPVDKNMGQDRVA